MGQSGEPASRWFFQDHSEDDFAFTAFTNAWLKPLLSSADAGRGNDPFQGSPSWGFGFFGSERLCLALSRYHWGGVSVGWCLQSLVYEENLNMVEYATYRTAAPEM